MEKINAAAHQIVDFLKAKNMRMFELEALIKMRNEAIENQKIVEEYLKENNLNKCLENINDNYYILMYCIIYKENLVNFDIIKKVVDNCDNKLIPFLHILMMESKITDEIVSKILTKIDKLDWAQKLSHNLGHLPFDYKYHILKREEISYEIKEQVLEKYNDIDEVSDEIRWDLLNEITNILGVGTDDYDLPESFYDKYPVLKDQKRALDILYEYKRNKKSVKKLNKN